MGNECGGPKYTPQRGDKVRVTTEVEILDDQVTSVPSLPRGRGVRGYRALLDGVEVVIPANADIEKLEPPVEVFKPGDVVRSKGSPRFRFALYEGGYVDLVNGLNNEGCVTKFTSADYEKIDLG